MSGGIGGRLLRHRGGRAGALLLAAVVTVALLGPLVTGDPDATDYGDQLASPSGTHWLGTDEAGRDVLARTAAGARTSLSAAVTVSLLTIGIGLVVGGTAGFLRGPLDTVASRLIDVLLGLPDLILALAIVGALGVGHGNLVLALALAGWAPLARLARSLALGSRSRLDVISARLAGVGRVRAFGTHVMPGMVAQVLVVAATGFGTVVLALAGLSFLGLGAQPPTAELGRMLSDSRGDLARSPWLAAGPGAVIVLTVAAAMLLSDALRDVLDPSEVTSRPPRPSGRVRVRPERNGGEARSAPGPAPVLAAKGLTVTYPDGTEAVRAVDLDVRAGECVAVVGESGSGKTTLGRAVLRLLPDGTEVSGRLEVDGADVLTLTGPDLRQLRGRTVGYVAQDPFGACDPLRSVGGHVAEAWRVHRLDVPDDLVDRVGALGVERADERLRERPHQWSGGMLQRATIAAAAAHNPLVTLADEPTNALDADHADGVLAALRRASRALLLISHDLGLVASHADRIAVMRGGEVVEIGPAREVLERPRHAYTRALLGASVRAPVPAGGGPSSDGNGSAAPRVGGGNPGQPTSGPTAGVTHRRDPRPDEPVVRAEGLVRRYGSGQRRSPGRSSVTAVDGISLTVRPGEIVGVSGPSGCGKSTLLRLLGGWECPDHGTVHYGDLAARPTRRHPARYPRAGYVMPVFQDPFASVDRRWPIWRIVTEPLTVGPEGAGRRDRRELAASWLERVGLAHLPPDTRPSELSGGQCQRVALARALAARPALLLADEPTARQDVLTAAAMTRLLRAAVADGTALVVVSHDTAWLDQLADRTVTLSGGAGEDTLPGHGLADRTVTLG